MIEVLGSISVSFVLIFLAEFGDKSQLVCFILASRHDPRPVFLAAACAFALLNVVAVAFGATLASLVAPGVLEVAVGLLFMIFGMQMLIGHIEANVPMTDRPAGSIFFSTFILIALSEMGDKTQLAVAGLSTAGNPPAIWIGATLALATTSALGVWMGRSIKQTTRIKLLHRLGGGLFLIFAAAAFIQAYQYLT